MLGKHTLNPKEETLLRITFDTTGRPGLFRKIVTLTTGSPGEKELDETVEGAVLEAPGAKIGVIPRQVDVGTVLSGSVKVGPFEVTNQGNLPLVITKIYVQGTGSALRDGAKEGVLVVEPGRTSSFEWSLEAEAAEGDHEDMIVIESNAKNAPKKGYMMMVHYRRGG